MPKPTDTRCRAMLKGGKQCENQVSYDEEGDNWSLFCMTHREEDAEAREAGEARVPRFDRQENKKSSKKKNGKEEEADE